jgi:hypothetical protein
MPTKKRRSFCLLTAATAFSAYAYRCRPDAADVEPPLPTLLRLHEKLGAGGVA